MIDPTGHEVHYNPGDPDDTELREDDPCGSCDSCGCDLSADEDDGSGLCDQCEFYADKASEE